MNGTMAPVWNLLEQAGSMGLWLPLFPLLAGMLLSLTDDELVARSQRGDSAAFGALVERYQDRIHSLCVRWLGDRVVAEEVGQDVFLSVWRALPRFRAEARFDTWLRRIAVNKCKNRRLYRKRRAYDRHDSIHRDEHDDGPSLQLVHGGPGTDARVHAGEAADVLERALTELSDDQRALIVLRDVEDLAYDEIATLLEVPRGTVKSRLHRARAALATALERSVKTEDVLG